MTTPSTQPSAQSSRYRTHRVGELSNQDADRPVRVAGWVHRRRSLGSLIFLELRDATGVVQCVLTHGTPAFEVAQQLSLESVVSIAGTLVLRAEQARNPRLPSGELELRADSLEVLSAAQALPFPIAEETAVPEELRLRHRYLDLRRARTKRNVLLRARVISRIRELMLARGFVEFQTPILTASSPEGARDFLVPSRVHPHKCYALPQAPQQFKQLLMVAGFDRYFQIAPCFRDEDARADRSPGEFYQLDIEMAFAEQGEIFETIEPVLQTLFSELGQKRVTAPPFPRITQREALERYASDKPDLRNPLVFSTLPAALTAGLVEESIAAPAWRALRAPGGARLPRRFFEERAGAVRHAGAQLTWLISAETERGPLARLPAPLRAELVRAAGVLPGDALLLFAGNGGRAQRAASDLRMAVGAALGEDTNNGFGAELAYFERQLLDTRAAVSILRASYFQDNVLQALPFAEHNSTFLNCWSSRELPIATVAATDVGALVARALLETRTAGRELIDVVGPSYTADGMAAELGTALGRSLKIQDVPRTQQAALFGRWMSAEAAAAMVETLGLLESGRAPLNGDRRVHGTTRLDQVLKTALSRRVSPNAANAAEVTP